MLKIAHVLTVPDSLVFLRGHAAFMRARGMEISVITSPGRALDDFGRREGVQTFGVEMLREISPVADLRSVAGVSAALHHLRPHLVHGHTPKGGLVAMLAARVARIKARIYHLRGLPLSTARGARRTLLRQAERTSCGLADVVVSVSSSLRDEALRERLCAPSKIRVLAQGSGNGVDARARFDPDAIDVDARARFRAAHGIPDDAPVVGFLGRLVRDKGIAELASAWPRIRAAWPAARLLLGGVFERRDALSGETRAALEGDPHVHVLGFIEDTPTFYASIDVLAFPSHREGFPNVPLEAAAMRVPVVASRATGCIDAVVDGKTGALVPVNDPLALADAIATYLSDAALRSSHGNAGRVRVLDTFVPDRIWAELADLYAHEISKDVA